jgi:hypothetical protein
VKHFRGLIATIFFSRSSMPRAPSRTVSGREKYTRRNTIIAATAITACVVLHECQCERAPPTMGARTGPNWHAEKKKPRATPRSALENASPTTAGPTISLDAPMAWIPRAIRSTGAEGASEARAEPMISATTAIR